MASITGTKVACTEFAGYYKLVPITATITSKEDTITVNATDHGIAAIDAIVGAVITGGLDAAFSYLQVSFSGAVITVKSFEQDGTDATDFTDTTVTITVLGH